MDLRNISPLGDLVIPSLGVDVAAGAVFTVSDEAGALLLEQPQNYELVKSKPAKSAPTE